MNLSRLSQDAPKYKHWSGSLWFSHAKDQYIESFFWQLAHTRSFSNEYWVNVCEPTNLRGVNTTGDHDVAGWSFLLSIVSLYGQLGKMLYRIAIRNGSRYSISHSIAGCVLRSGIDCSDARGRYCAICVINIRVLSRYLRYFSFFVTFFF